MLFYKKTIFSLLFILYSFLFANYALASDEFDTNYQIAYTVQPDASVVAVQNIKLTNKLANIYANEYQISLGTTHIKNILAKDNYANLTPQIKKENNTTHIKVLFPHKTVGKGQTLNLTISYISNDYAIKKGKVLEIGIPKMAEIKKLNQYQIKLIIPNVFEKPSFISPKPLRISKQATNKIYFFNKKNLENKNISAIFGSSQVFNFSLKYHLKNDVNSQSYYEISLPPDTPFQKIYLNNIKPEPLNLRLDIDGNWLAKYLLKEKSELEIIASGAAKVFMKPRNVFTATILTNKNDYLSSQKYWETNNPNIKSLAQKLKTPLAIYNFVIKNLLYDYARIQQKPERRGAVNTLKNKNSAICMEFTDLFIALARAAGIPSREVNGFAYTNNPQ